MSPPEGEARLQNKNESRAAPVWTGHQWRSLLTSPNGRISVYALILAFLAGGCCFYRLSEGTLFGDEAAFACTTDRMSFTGDWVVPFIIAEKPHLNATPLYNWLTLAIAPLFDQTALWYRFWSAAFGVGCVLSAFALGTLLFRSEVGLLAGLLLTFNRDFLFCHGIRFGGMDAMLAFFITTAAFCYAWLQYRPIAARKWPVWGLLGLCIGLAWLSKPPVFGGFFLTMIGIHHFWAHRREPLGIRLAGPMLAFAVGCIVAAPWYLLLWSRLGNPCLHALFIYNSVGRAVEPTHSDPLCCHHAIWHASNGFKLIGPALACAFACRLFHHQRSQWGLLLFLAGSYLIALSAAGNAGNYIFYVFPILSVLLAGLLLETAPRLVARFRPDLARKAAIAGAGLAVVLVYADFAKTFRTIVHPSWVHPPVGIYERLMPELEMQRCRFVLFDFPTPDGTSGQNGGNFEDLYYATRMPLADRVRSGEELKCLLEDGKPAIVVLPPSQFLRPQLAGFLPEVRVEENPWVFYTYPVLTFHGGDAKLNAAELVRLSRGSQP